MKRGSNRDTEGESISGSERNNGGIKRVSEDGVNLKRMRDRVTVGRRDVDGGTEGISKQTGR